MPMYSVLPTSTASMPVSSNCFGKLIIAVPVITHKREAVAMCTFEYMAVSPQKSIIGDIARVKRLSVRMIFRHGPFLVGGARRVV